MNRFLQIAMAVTLLSAVAPAQVRRPAGGAKVEETTNVINDCERRTNTFKRTVSRNVKGAAPNLKHDTDQLEEALNKVGDSWNRDHDPQKTRGFVSAAIRVGQEINRYMVTFHGDADLENQWVAVRGELNRLAQTFNLPPVRW